MIMACLFLPTHFPSGIGSHPACLLHLTSGNQLMAEPSAASSGLGSVDLVSQC